MIMTNGAVPLLGGFSITKALKKTGSIATAPARKVANTGLKVLQVANIINPPKKKAADVAPTPDASGESFMSSGTGKLVLLGVGGLAAVAIGFKLVKG